MEKGIGALFASVVLFIAVFVISFLMTRSLEYSIIITAVLLIAYIVLFYKLGIIKFY